MKEVVPECLENPASRTHLRDKTEIKYVIGVIEDFDEVDSDSDDSLLSIEDAKGKDKVLEEIEEDIYGLVTSPVTVWKSKSCHMIFLGSLVGSLKEVMEKDHQKGILYPTELEKSVSKVDLSHYSNKQLSIEGFIEEGYTDLKKAKTYPKIYKSLRIYSNIASICQKVHRQKAAQVIV